MRPFAYVKPSSIDEAVRALGSDGAVALAGGTDLLSLMKDDVARPGTLVDLRGIESLDGIELSSRGLRLGATVVLERLLQSPELARDWPALVQAVRGIHSAQIRAMGTVGGDLCQRPRCWYFRSGFGLLARRDGRSLVEEGDHRYHAIFGDGPARFVNPSSLAPALVAHGALVEVVGARGEREMPVADLFRAPTAEGESELTLEPGELVVAVRVPPPVAGRRSAVYEVRPRQTLDWPLAAAAAVIDLDGETVRDARVVMGHVAPTPRAVDDAARLLRGRPLDGDAAGAVADAAVADAKPLSGNRYKVQLARVAVRRALLRAAGREEV